MDDDADDDDDDGDDDDDDDDGDGDDDDGVRKENGSGPSLSCLSEASTNHDLLSPSLKNPIHKYNCIIG